MPNLQVTDVALFLFNIVNNDYQQNSRVLNTSIRNKSFGRLLDNLPNIFLFY